MIFESTWWMIQEQLRSQENWGWFLIQFLISESQSDSYIQFCSLLSPNFLQLLVAQKLSQRRTWDIDPWLGTTVKESQQRNKELVLEYLEKRLSFRVYRFR